MNYMVELTTREKEILELIAQNYTNSENCNQKRN